jgi:(4S)-4-hydroxy-5-phosphonooxypentane-2,3-dione isomerase
MLIIHVHVHVKPESVEPFKEASVENARKSIQEPGIARFDVVQDTSDPAQFILIEVYRYPEARAEHRETAHYKKWRDAVADFMAEPRTSKQYTNLFPLDESWA